MRLTAFTDYGLRVLMRMAGEPDRSFSTAELAVEFDLSRHHLLKIIGALAKGGVVTTQRGGGGGALLARRPSDIRLGDIVVILEDGQGIVQCFAPGGDCPIAGCCALKTRLRAAERAFIDDLNRSTLADCALPTSFFAPLVDAPLPRRLQ